MQNERAQSNSFKKTSSLQKKPVLQREKNQTRTFFAKTLNPHIFALFATFHFHIPEKTSTSSDAIRTLRKRTLPRKSIFRRRSPDTMPRRNSINFNSLRRNCVLMYPRLTFAWFSLRLLIRRNRPRRQLRRGALRAPPSRASTRKLLYILALHIPPTPTL